MTGITEYADVVSFSQWISGAFLWEETWQDIQVLNAAAYHDHPGTDATRCALPDIPAAHAS